MKGILFSARRQVNMVNQFQGDMGRGRTRGEEADVFCPNYWDTEMGAFALVAHFCFFHWSVTAQQLLLRFSHRRARFYKVNSFNA